MKKILKRMLLFAMMLVMLPLSTFLVACGATPADTANAVMFVSDIYDEATGKAIFEVDLMVPTELTFKCNPSTAENKPSYTIPVEGQTNSSLNRSRFDFKDGVITVNHAKFEPVEIKITVNGYTDQCIVRLKEYPVEIYAAETDVVLNAYGSYTICAMGKFKLADGTYEHRPLLEKDFNFSVYSDNETVISVPNHSRLTVCSERLNTNTANVTVKLLDESGKEKGISFTVKFTVKEMAKDGFLLFEGFDSFVENGSTVVVDANEMTANVEGEYEIRFKAYFISSMDTLLENIGGFECLTESNEYVSFDNANQLIKIKSDYNGEYVVTVWTNLFKEDGSTLGITFTIDFIAEVNP